jgi:hypothetical protein
METRDILLKAEKGTLSWERIYGGKIRFKTISWDDAVVTNRNQVLEIAMVDNLPALVKATKPIEYLDIETTGFQAAGYGPQA